MEKLKPKYPAYIISKGRYENCLTTKFFERDELEFKLVVEPQEFDFYSVLHGKENIHVLPFSNLGQGSIPARNWVKNHATENGHERHWIFDDNIRKIFRRYKGKKIPCNANIALSVVEEFVDRYENVAIAGLNYDTFVQNFEVRKPFNINCHVYSCLLILNSLPHKWRGRYNEDTDLCLQVLADGWCTILMNAFLIDKTATMMLKGGNTDSLYQGDGRLKMARSLERMWPQVVKTKRRFNRPQHVVHKSWMKFDTPLKRKPGLKIDDQPNEFGMRLNKVKPNIKTKSLEQWFNGLSQ
jgi:hypothetical protein